MQSNAVELPANPVETAPELYLNVVVAYENLETYKRARGIYDFLVQHLEKEVRFSIQLWKFDLLKIAKLSEMAAHDAREADIIMLACRGGHELPEQVTRWIESWLAEKGNPLALVALFDGDPEEHRQARNWLADAARRGGLQFFVQPEERAGLAQAIPGQTHQDRTVAALAGAVRGEFTPRWQTSE